MSFNKRIQLWDHHLSQGIEQIYHCRCLQIMVLEKILKSPLDCKAIKPVNPEGNQLRISIRRIDAEDETPTLWPHNAKSWLTGKDSDAGEDWRQEEKGMTEDEMIGWHHWLNGREFEQTPGDKPREAWHTAVHGISKSQTWLGSWTRSNNNHPRKVSHALPANPSPQNDGTVSVPIAVPATKCHTNGIYSRMS